MASNSKNKDADNFEDSLPTAPSTSSVKTEKLHPIFRIVNGPEKSEPVTINKSTKTVEEYAKSLEENKRNGSLYAEVNEPVWHKVQNNMVTPPIIAENLSLQFKDLPIFGAPDHPSSLETYEEDRIRQFVGSQLDDTEYEELKNYCNPDNLRNGSELEMYTTYPVQGILRKNQVSPCVLSDSDLSSDESDSNQSKAAPHLMTLKILRERQKVRDHVYFPKLLKYRGVKQFPLKDQIDKSRDLGPPDLEPGKDVVYHIRVYRPFGYKHSMTSVFQPHRRSIFSCDVVATGRTLLVALRDKFVCRNDLDMRLDLSNNPDAQPSTPAKTVFPSGFLFINNVFYVDDRGSCHDTSAPIRQWARHRNLGQFPVRAMRRLCLSDILVRLAHPEVYVHQGNCEHLFIFSQMRLLSRSDPLHLSAYPCHTLISQNQSLYCTTCVEYAAKWLVVGSERVPFDPAFFCEICFKQYLYKDGQKIGDFKAYAYKGNQINVKNTVNYLMVIDYN